MSPFVAKKYGHLLKGGMPYFVDGLVEEDVGWRVRVDGEEGVEIVRYLTTRGRELR